MAPADGVVTKVEQLQVGNRVNASQTLFWLISGQPWIEANFKEDQLAHMRVGQPATIKVDAYDHDAEGSRRQLQPRHRLQLRAAAARERHRQLGEGRPAPARAPGPRRGRARTSARRPQRRAKVDVVGR